MGRKKASWFTCTKLRHRCVESPAWRKRMMEMRPIMLIITMPPNQTHLYLTFHMNYFFNSFPAEHRYSADQ